MDMTGLGLGQQAPKETAGHETYNGERGVGCGAEFGASDIYTGACRVPAHERHIRFQEQKSVSVEIARDEGTENRSSPLQACFVWVHSHNLTCPFVLCCGDQAHALAPRVSEAS
jgi:hypothetical protein